MHAPFSNLARLTTATVEGKDPMDAALYRVVEAQWQPRSRHAATARARRA